MKFQKLILCAVSCVALGAVSSASAQKDLQKRFEELKRPNIGEFEVQPEQLRGPGLNSGSMHWISPMLDNSPGTINGETFTIDGKRLMRTFELSTINPNGAKTANAHISCFTADGALLNRYSKSYTIPPFGAINWNANAVGVPASGDGGVTDVDAIWCSVSADVPVVAFGWTVRRFGGETSRYHFSLERASAN